MRDNKITSGHNSDAKAKFSLSEGVIVTILPVIAYGAAYYFEKGYLQAFNLPEFLIKVSLERFFYALSMMVSVCIFSIAVIDSVLEAIPRRWIIYWHLSIPAFFLYLPVIVMGITHHKTDRIIDIAFSILTIVATVVMVIIYIAPFFIDGKEKHLAFLKYINRHDSLRRRKTLSFQIARSPLSFIYLLLFFTALIFPFVASGIGRLVANETADMLVTTIDNKNYAILRKYEDLNVYIEVKKAWISLYEQQVVLQRSYLLLDSQPEGLIYQSMKIKR